METSNDLLSLLPEHIFGAEEDGAAGDDQSNQGEPGNQSDDTGNNTGEEVDPKPEDKAEDDGRIKALRAERKLRKEAEAEAAKLRAEVEASKRKEMDELQLAQAERDDALNENSSYKTRLEKLTEGFRRNTIVNAIEAEAKKQNFIDVSDALNYFEGVDTVSLFQVEQDEEDPSQVSLDPKAVTSAVKKLATSKPHYINKGTDNGAPTGSPFGGSRSKANIDEEATLRQRYSNL